jgi:predicted transcriptional regulator
MVQPRRSPGELEAQVLHVLWAAPEGLTAREILTRIPGGSVAHTTVLTALERLREKGHVLRGEGQQRSIRFTAARSEEEHAGLAMLERLGGVSDREAALLQFAGSLQPEDVDVLRRALDASTRRRKG